MWRAEEITFADLLNPVTAVRHFTTYISSFHPLMQAFGLHFTNEKLTHLVLNSSKWWRLGLNSNLLLKLVIFPVLHATCQIFCKIFARRLLSSVTRNAGWKLGFEKPLDGSSLQTYKGLQMCATELCPPNKPQGYAFGGRKTPRSFLNLLKMKCFLKVLPTSPTKLQNSDSKRETRHTRDINSSVSFFPSFLLQ